MTGRVKTCEAIVKGHNVPTPAPESFKVLVRNCSRSAWTSRSSAGTVRSTSRTTMTIPSTARAGKALPEDEITMDDDLPNGKGRRRRDEAADAGFEIQDEDNVFGLLNISFTMDSMIRENV